jgi:acetylornithine/N-succinyldiaminopimelate aminotransferase
MSKTETAIQLEQQYVLQTYRRPPFVIERGEGVMLYDTEGRTYLDLVAGIAVNALGYGDSEALAVLTAQADKLIHVSNLYHTAPQAQLAQMLCQASFAQRVFFCNSGSEAADGALKFARKWARTNFDSNKIGVVAFEHSFHGRTFGALSATSKEKYRAPFEPLVPGVTFAPFNDVDAASLVINDQTCAVIVEPVQGEGGIHPADPAFLQALRELCDAHNALLIFDEVQCGLGRTGTLWAHEPAEVSPDMMTLAKPLGGGLPIGAVLLTQNVADVIKPGDHGSTFAAGSLVTAVAQVVFRRLCEPAFLAAVQEKGKYLGQGLRSLQAKHDTLVEIRGRGLMWGLDLNVEAVEVIGRGYKEGIIMASAGPNTLRLVPPLVIEKEQLDQALEKLDLIFSQLEGG